MQSRPQAPHSTRENALDAISGRAVRFLGVYLVERAYIQQEASACNAFDLIPAMCYVQY
jgi:hypothetical protein